MQNLWILFFSDTFTLWLICARRWIFLIGAIKKQQNWLSREKSLGINIIFLFSLEFSFSETLPKIFACLIGNFFLFWLFLFSFVEEVFRFFGCAISISAVSCLLTDLSGLMRMFKFEKQLECDIKLNRKFSDFHKAWSQPSLPALHHNASAPNSWQHNLSSLNF